MILSMLALIHGFVFVVFDELTLQQYKNSEPPFKVVMTASVGEKSMKRYVRVTFVLFPLSASSIQYLWSKSG